MEGLGERPSNRATFAALPERSVRALDRAAGDPVPGWTLPVAVGAVHLVGQDGLLRPCVVRLPIEAVPLESFFSLRATCVVKCIWSSGMGFGMNGDRPVHWGQGASEPTASASAGCVGAGVPACAAPADDAVPVGLRGPARARGCAWQRDGRRRAFLAGHPQRRTPSRWVGGDRRRQYAGCPAQHRRAARGRQ